MKKKYSFTFVRGLKEHAVHAEELYALRRRTLQDGNACTDPAWFAQNSVDSRRRPWTILMLADGVPVGAVLLREQMRFKIPLGYFYACDAAGDEFVLARPEEREACLRRCMEALLERLPSAIVFLATQFDYRQEDWRQLRYSSGQGVALYRLPIKHSLDDTLAQFGSHTRRNLRYYARNIQREGAVYVPKMTPAEIEEAAAQLHPTLDYPISPPALREYFAATHRVQGGFATGLRAANGDWLSVITGWRRDGKTSIFYQMNRVILKKASLSTAMRCLLMEHEVAIGTRDLVFVTYTNEVTERGCAEDVRYDLLLAKRSWRLLLLDLFARRLPVGHRLRVCLERARSAVPSGRPGLGGARSEL